MDGRALFRADQPDYRTAVDQVSSFKFLGLHISSDLTWSLNSSVLIKKAQQCLYFLLSLKKAYLSPRILVNFYRCTTESILTNCISVWYGGCCVADRKALQRVENVNKDTYLLLEMDLKWVSIILQLSAVCGVSAYTSYRYVFVNENKNWTEAQSYCRETHTDLATVNNMEEMKNLNTTLKDKTTSSVWIGLNRGNTGRWLWSLADGGLYSEGEEYRNWYSGQPDNSGGIEYCVTMWNNPGKWNDDRCDKLHPFVCYDEKNSTHRYIFMNETKTWAEAQSYCREHFTDLVTVRNRTENDEIWGLSHNNDGVWIGLFNDSWQWSDQSNSSFRYWRSGPDNYGNNGQQQCAVVTEDGQWTNLTCDNKLPFVCRQNKLVLVNLTLTWKEALRYCRENYVDLVSVHSEKVQSWVKELAQKASTDHVWLGLRHTCTLNFWFWVSGESICYQNWAPGNGTRVEDCGSGERSGAVGSSGGQQWVSLPQNQQLNFICSNY
ncbi:macrophage mannose receptor 1-like [Hoplias malabaricus]|uniref:macrophage mannose receptor 1-like n=1 Tax=Hoplias malabaricus TaxID=27720 RepID=UPI0034626A2D